MNGIQNCEYFVPIDKESIKKRAQYFLNRLRNQSVQEKVAYTALPILKKLADVLTVVGCALFCMGLVTSSGAVLIVGGAAAAVGAACLLGKDFESGALKLEKAVYHLQASCSYVDEKKFHNAALEIERAQEILPESEISDTRIYLNQLLKHLRNNEKEAAITAAEKLIAKTEEEIAAFTRMHARVELIDYLRRQVAFGMAVRNDFDRIYQRLDPELKDERRDFYRLYRELFTHVMEHDPMLPRSPG